MTNWPLDLPARWKVYRRGNVVFDDTDDTSQGARMAQGRRPNPAHNEFWYLLLASIIGLLALAGYAGYVLYPRFDLPAATGIGLLALAVGAGVASFFSPCSFPLLVTLLSRESRTDTDSRRMRLNRSLQFGSALAIGAVVFLTLTGLGIALGASAIFGDVTFTSTVGRVLRLTIGTLLILLGLLQFGVIQAAPFDGVHRVSAPMMRRQAQLRQRHPTLGFGLYGFIYILAGFG